MVLCPGFQKNGRPCTNILEKRNKYCKTCGWKIDPEIFLKEAISCPNVPLSSHESEPCGTWIERGQQFCDQCGWEVNHSFFDCTFGQSGATTQKQVHGRVSTDRCNSAVNQLMDLNLNRESRHSERSHSGTKLTSVSPKFDRKQNSSSPSSSGCSSNNSEGASCAESPRTSNKRVLFIHNLNVEKITVDGLFNLFGCYGLVEIVKIFFNRKNSGLIQMENHESATRAIHHLEKVSLWGYPLRVSFSNSVERVIVEEHSKGTKDYRRSALHRYRPGTDYTHSCNPPSCVIHLSYLLESISLDDIKDVFSEYGKIVHVEIFSLKGRKQALIEYENKDSACQAVMAMHNFTLPDNKRLMVSFSRHKALNRDHRKT